MAVSLSKGGRVSLSKEAGPGGLKTVTVGLGWDERATDGASFDLDATAFVLGENGKVRNDGSDGQAGHDFIFYNNLELKGGGVVHQGDNTDGGGDGDDEQVKIDFSKLDPTIKTVAVCVTIHEAETRNQNFGMVTNAFVRVVNDADGKELARYDLSEDMSTETAMIFAEVYNHGGEWKFKAVGQGFAGGLGPLAKNYGVHM